MSLSSWLRWLNWHPGHDQHHSPHRRTVTSRHSFVPRLDILEDRTVPSALHAALDIGNASLSHATVQRVDAATAMPQFTLTASGKDNRAPDLGEHQNLQVPQGNKVAFHVYAEGVQIYTWNGTSWTFVAPDAVLYADAGHHGVVGTHYGGPTWESNSGSKVVATVVERATADPDSIDWLLLKTTSTEGSGPFAKVTYIQRVNTVGGKAPTTPGTSVGEVARVPYSTEYFFYRAHH